MFLSIKSYLARFRNRPGVSSGLQAHILRASWEDVIESIHKGARGKTTLLHTTPSGELVVRVKNHAWLQELAFYKRKLERRVSQKNKNIKSIRLTV